MTWVGMNVLRTGDQGPSAVEVVVVGGRSRTIAELAVSARSVKLRSAF